MVLMTAAHQQPATAQRPESAALLSDKARARELYEQVQGTEREAEFVRISSEHPEKNLSVDQYQAFLAALESAFGPAQQEPPATSTPEVAAEPLSQDPATEAELEDVPLSDHADELPPATDESPASEANAEEVQFEVLTARPARDLAELSFFSQLASMLGDGGLLKFSVAKVGERLTLGIFPEHAKMPELNVPLTLTEAPVWFDEQLPRHLAAYTAAQMDAAQIIAQAALKQQTANQKAAEKTQAAATPKKSTDKASTATSKTSKDNGKKETGKAQASPKTPAKPVDGSYKVVFKANEGTQITATDGSKPVAVQLGENHLPQGAVLITTTHEHFGTHTKTYLIRQDGEIDLDPQQSVLLQVETQPESAAVDATNGEMTLSILQGQRRLAEGEWTITAEAAGHQSASQTLTLKIGEPRAIKLQLQAEPF